MYTSDRPATTAVQWSNFCWSPTQRLQREPNLQRCSTSTSLFGTALSTNFFHNTSSPILIAIRVIAGQLLHAPGLPPRSSWPPAPAWRSEARASTDERKSNARSWHQAAVGHHSNLARRVAYCSHRCLTTSCGRIPALGEAYWSRRKRIQRHGWTSPCAMPAKAANKPMACYKRTGAKIVV